jgi:ABC-type branched-subunit amino acid transport system permease subunit
MMGGLLASGLRIEGVYFALITQALLLAVFTLVRNQQRVTGGVVGIKNIAELQLWGLTFDPYKQNVTKLFFLVAWTLTGCLVLCGLLVRTKFGRLLTAIRDNENRVLALGYNTGMYKTFLFTVAGGLGGLAGALYVVANTLAGPEYLSIVFSIMAVIWVAVGGRGTLIGAVVGTLLVGWANTYISSAFPKHWTMVLGGLFVLLVVFLPRGLVGKAGRGALLGAMLGILYVDQVVDWIAPFVIGAAQDLLGTFGSELTETTANLITKGLGGFFVVGMIFVPRAILTLVGLLIRVIESLTRRAGLHQG